MLQLKVILLCTLIFGYFTCNVFSTSKLQNLQIGVLKSIKECKIKAEPGDRVKVHYTGKLMENGDVFDSSLDRDPIDFEVSAGSMIKGFDRGVLGMCVGEKRKLKIPSDMGYGSQGSPPKIPQNSDLIFEVEMVQIDKQSKSEL